ncbi:hypothetical protein CHUAL_006676 [Chamberlinius hualienensis]
MVFKSAVCLVLLIAVKEAVLAAEIGPCTTVRYAYTSKVKSVPTEPVSGEHLQICQQGRTCCTEEMEQTFIAQSRQEFHMILNTTVNLLQTTYAARAQKFDEFFKELLKKSKKDFHEMFLKTYGMLYEKNADVFSDLFDGLESYYAFGNVNLMDVLDSFFTTLYQKMFTVLNAQYTFDQKYLGCVSEFMEDLQPFGDVPRKLSLQIRRAFVAARVFVRGLVFGKEVAKNMLDVPFSPECNKALAKMSYCPQCQGLVNVKPCSNYCLNVMKGCLAYHAELDKEWNKYIDALLLLADRLEGPFNIESVVDPIDIKISDAIMNFQESGPQVSQKVFHGCGQPRLGKRDVSKELIFDTLKFAKPTLSPRPTTAAGTSLDRLVKDIRTKIKGTKSFWTRLSPQMCSNDLLSTGPNTDDDQCWNGLTKAKYESQIMGDGVVNQAKNPEVNLDISRQNSITNEQIVLIRTVTDRLNSAYNGMDVVWSDSADWAGSGDSSGSGDGGGSGDGETGRGSPAIGVETDDFGFTTSTATAPDIRRPDVVGTTTTTVSSAPPRMTLNRAFNVITVPLLIAWLGSMIQP